MSDEQTNYWVVGAAFGGTDHQDIRFIEDGIWKLGWSKEEQPDQHKKASEIKSGDRIAIKRMLGKGDTSIKILHLGIVKTPISKDDSVEVNWVQTDIQDRTVPIHGCMASIHGPFKYDDEWTRQVFCL